MPLKPKTKICSQCRTPQRLTDFSRSVRASDGRHNHCMNCRSMASQSKTAPTIEINGLTFAQHRESVTDCFNASRQGHPEPAPLYAFYGGIKLDAPAISARVNWLAFKGYIKNAA